MTTDGEKIIGFIYIIMANASTFAAVIMFYTALIKKQAKVEYLLKQVCDKLNISTETHL